MAKGNLTARDAKVVPAAPGTYVLILRAESDRKIRVGRLGRLTVPPGFYAYVGSAFGPGGLRARIARHLRRQKKRRWHVDYLRTQLNVINVWWATALNRSHATRQRECEWARRLCGMGGEVLFRKLGASDCRCASHLFHFTRQPLRTDFLPTDATVSITSHNLFP